MPATSSLNHRQEAKLCPFCGSKPTGTFFSSYGVTAINCPNRDCVAFSRQVSVEVWNTRFSDPQVDMATNALLLIARAQKIELPVVVHHDGKFWEADFHGDMDMIITPITAYSHFCAMSLRMQEIENEVIKQARLAEVRKELFEKLTPEEREAVGLTKP